MSNEQQQAVSTVQRRVRARRTLQLGLGLSLLGLVSAFYLLAYRPARDALQDLHGRIAGQDKALAERRSVAAALPRTRAEVQVLRSELARFRVVPHDQELTGFLEELSRLAEASSLQVVSMKPSERHEHPLFYRLPIRMALNGRFEDVWRFLKSVEQSPRLLRVRAVDVENTVELDGTVKAQLTFELYNARRHQEVL